MRLRKTLRRSLEARVCFVEKTPGGGRHTLGWKKAPYLAGVTWGCPGMGYEYLRLAAPRSLRSLLLW
jgi:hypothetical protein